MLGNFISPLPGIQLWSFVCVELVSSHLNKRQKFIGLAEEVIKQTYLSHVMRKPAFCICKNKGTDQLHGNHAADQAFVFAT